MINLSKKFFALLIATSLLISVGCIGGKGRESSPVSGPSESLPIEYANANIVVENANQVYNSSNINAKNIAIDVPADGNNYLINLTNKGAQQLELSLVSATPASIRVSIADKEEKEEASQSLYNESLAMPKGCIEARLNFLRNSKSHRSSKRASATRGMVYSPDHSHESLNNEYAIQVGTLCASPAVTLHRCKLVHITEHAKFFVDQESHGITYYDPVKMEAWVTGSDGDISLAKAFDSYAYGNISMYSLLEEKFGKVADIDKDGKLSVLITPILPVWSPKLEGLFPYETMIPDTDDYDIGLSEHRDLVMLAQPNRSSEKLNRHVILNTLIHETQHAVNFSLRAYSNNTYKGHDPNSFDEELGFDEGCSVCAEALFRRAWGKAGVQTLYDYKTGGSGIEYAGNDSRFNHYLKGGNQTLDSVYPFDANNFNYGYTYGRNGLFILYLHDRFGINGNNFKNMVQQNFQGANLKNTIPAILCNNSTTTLEDLERDWHFALQNEYLKTEQNNAGISMSQGARYEYADWLKLENKNKKINNAKLALEPRNTVMIKLQPSIANIEGNKYRFFIKSKKEGQSLEGININLIKLSN